MTAKTDSVWLNGRVLPRSAAGIDPLSGGLLFGSGVYDTTLCRAGAPVALSRHLARLTRDASRFSLPAPREEAVRLAAASLTEATGIMQGRLRITLAAGPPAEPEAAPVALITLTPLQPSRPTAGAAITAFRRNEFSPLAGCKYTACPENLLAQRAAAAAGFDEAVFLNTAGWVCEGAFSNLFAVRDGCVITPALSSGCLPGITREVILELCAAAGIPHHEQDLLPAELDSADGIFLTSSIRGVQPVHRLDARTFPDTDPLTMRIRDLYAAWLDGEP